MSIELYLKNNNIVFEKMGEGIFQIDDKIYLEIPSKNGLLFDENFNLLLSKEEESLLQKVDYMIYYFGSRFFYSEIDKDDVFNVKSFHPLFYLGNSNNTTYIPLSIHGSREVLSGTRSYKDYAKKAKFLNVYSLGIVEFETAGGILSFQKACKSEGVKPISGSSLFVSFGKLSLLCKFYVKNKAGWSNLCTMLKDHSKNRVIDSLDSYSDGLICVVEANKEIIPSSIVEYLSNLFGSDFYYEFNTSQFTNEEYDESKLKTLEKNWNKLDRKRFVLNNDIFYLEQEDSVIKNLFGELQKDASRFVHSTDQYFKTYDEITSQLGEVIPDSNYYNLFSNQELIANSCDFVLEREGFLIPSYGENPRGEMVDLIQQGLEEKIESGELDSGKMELYRDRIQEEMEVFDAAKVHEYFLITRDICKHADDEGIVRGLARGSAGGSFCCYLLDIVKINAIEWGLFFERFMNPGRIKQSMPDIDLDFSSIHQKDIKQYIIQRFGVDYTCYIGTYGLFKIKNLLTDIATKNGVSFEDIKSITKILPDTELTELKTMRDLFKFSSSNVQIKTFFQKYPHLIELMYAGLGSVRNRSIHAAGVIIAPDDIPIYKRVPVYWSETENCYISEFSGSEMEEMGFLKEDILGLKQLDKLGDTIKKVKDIYGEFTPLYKIPLDLPEVLSYFKKGWTQDVFQFNSSGMRNFLKYMNPDSIFDLIAANALYRPGTLMNNIHKNYVDVKNGHKDPEYFPSTEGILSETMGNIIYQEDLMALFRHVAGYSLQEADDIRRVIGKKKMEELKAVKPDFFEKSIARGYNQEDLEDLWEKILKFGNYSFNKCIAGSERILKNVGGKYPFYPTIGEMYKIKNSLEYAKSIGNKSSYYAYNKKGYGIGYSVGRDGVTVPNEIINITYQGVRPVYKIKLIDGSTIRVTDNHRHPVKGGIKQTKDLIVGEDEMYVVQGSPNRFNYAYPVIPFRVKSVELDGEEEVYDVEMGDPFHNFLSANGVVTCNSHSVAYALTGYYSAYYKSEHPTVFWDTAFSHLQYNQGKAEELKNEYLNEIQMSSDIQILPPDINKSEENFKTDHDKGIMYWGLQEVKQVGGAAIAQLSEKKQEYFSFQHFFEIHNFKGSKINKAHYENLIFAGAFDSLENVENLKDRENILTTLYSLLEKSKKKFTPTLILDNHLNFSWAKMQHKVTGFSETKYDEFKQEIPEPLLPYYREGLEEFFNDYNSESDALLIGSIIDFTIHKYKKTLSMCKIKLNISNINVNVILWNEEYQKHKNSIVKNKVLIIFGKRRYDDRQDSYTLHSNKNCFIKIV